MSLDENIITLKTKNYNLHFLFFPLILCLLNNCEEKKALNAKLKIVCTTSIIADAFRNIAKDSAEVIALMGAGVDPHLYKATHGDIKKLLSADIVFYNGLHLEGKMGEILKKLSRQKPVIALGDVLAKRRLIIVEQETQTPDPHIWFDISLWKEAVKHGADKLIEFNSEKFERKSVEYFQKNAEQYIFSLEKLNKKVHLELSKISEVQRTLITSHDAFSYFGRAYRFNVRGLQGISTLSDFGLRDVSDLVNFIVKNKIKAIFVETSMSEQSINAVIKGCEGQGYRVLLGGKLFSDALGKAGTPAGTYTGMIEANVNTITKALE